MRTYEPITQDALLKIEQILLHERSLRPDDIHTCDADETVEQWFAKWSENFDNLESTDRWKWDASTFKRSRYVPLWLQVAKISGRTHVARLLLEDSYGDEVDNLSAKQQIALYLMRVREREENL